MTERLLIAARDGIYKDFMARMRPAPTDRVLDVGVSDVINAGANVLERKYAYRHNITACGLSDGRDFQHAYPERAIRAHRAECASAVRRQQL